MNKYFVYNNSNKYYFCGFAWGEHGHPAIWGNKSSAIPIEEDSNIAQILKIWEPGYKLIPFD